MKSVLKMVLLVLVLLIIMSNDGRPEHVLPKTLEGSLPQFLPPPPPPIPPQFRPNRNSYSPENREEILKQRNAEHSANTQWLKEATEKYSPDSWYLLMSYDSLPESSSVSLLKGGIVSSRKTIETFRFLRGRSRIDLLISMETNVHEIAHGYFDQNIFRYLRDNNIVFNPDNANGFIYISPHLGYFISFPLEAMFPSSELSEVIPDNLRTYRYDTYINGTTSTQSDGVIGLLNELHAYYCGARFCYDMLEAYKAAAGSDASGLFEWVTHTQSSMSAYYEFDFFISEYLLLMKKKYPDNYDLLRSYPPFSESYMTLKKLYSDLIDRYLDRINTEMNILNSKGGTEIRIKSGWLWVRSGSSHVASGTPLFSDEREILLPVLEGRRYREIRNDFGI
jgi:hypothetical protein